MASRISANELDRQYRQNRNDIEALHERLDETDKLVKDTNKKVVELDAKIETKLAAHDTRFDRLDGQMAEVLDILRKRAS